MLHDVTALYMRGMHGLWKQDRSFRLFSLMIDVDRGWLCPGSEQPLSARRSKRVLIAFPITSRVLHTARPTFSPRGKGGGGISSHSSFFLFPVVYLMSERTDGNSTFPSFHFLLAGITSPPVVVM